MTSDNGADAPTQDQSVMMAELPGAMHALADSNVAIAEAFKRRANRVWITTIFALIASAGSLAGVGLILSNQSNNAVILRDVEQATNPNSPFSQQANARIAIALEQAVSCIEIHADTNYARAHNQPLPKVPTYCLTVTP